MNVKTCISNLFNFNDLQTSRSGWIDYAKGIAIILVVHRHVGFGLQENGIQVPGWMLDMNDMLYSFRMPLFFILSGLFFGRSLARRGAGGFLVSKVNTLLYPYLIWSVLMIALQIIFHNIAHSEREIGDFLNIIIQPRANAQLWYLFALFNVSLIYLLLSLLFKRNSYLQFPVAFVFLAAAPLVQHISTFYDIMLHYIFFCIGNAAAPYFFDKKIQTKLASGLSLGLLLPVFVVTQYYFLHHQQMNLFLYAVVAIIGALFTIKLSFLLEKHNWLPFLKTIGYYSLYIYVLHVPIISLIRYTLLTDLDVTNVPLLVTILLFVGIFFSILAYRICLQLKLKFLFTGPFKIRKKHSIATVQNPTS